MLGWRVGLSAVMIPALLALFYFDARIGQAAPIFLTLLLLLAGRCTWEMQKLLTRGEREPALLPVLIAVLACIAAGWVFPLSGASAAPLMQLGGIAITFSIAVLALFFLAAAGYREPGGHLERLGSEIFIVLYVGLLLSITAQLRFVAGHAAGYLAIGSLLIATKTGDIGAYFIGRAFGKKKMCPHLSPGKTWAGFYGALGTATIASWAWFTWATPALVPDWSAPPAHWSLLFGLVIGAVGVVGDLCESLLKRDAQMKDSAELMPGFGGLLDLLDSIIFAGPVAVLLWLTLPLSP